MIKFYFEDQFAGAKASAMVVTQAEDASSVVSAFKTFLSLAGYHPDTIERVRFTGDEQGFRQSARGDGNPAQGDFFDDDEHEQGGI